jgi:hypothetical protein
VQVASGYIRALADLSGPCRVQLSTGQEIACSADSVTVVEGSNLLVREPGQPWRVIFDAVQVYQDTAPMNPPQSSADSPS